MTTIRKHSELTYDQYLKIYKVPPVPIIKPISHNLDIPPLELSPKDKIKEVLEIKSDLTQNHSIKPHKVSKDIFCFPLDSDLPEIIELNREDSDYTLGQGNFHQSKYHQAELLDVLITTAVDPFLLAEANDYTEDKEDDDILHNKNKNPGVSNSIGAKFYSMNRDGDYSSTTALSGKGTPKQYSSKLIEKDLQANIVVEPSSGTLDMDDFNPKMFKYSLQGEKKDYFGQAPVRKYSEPVHKNGAKTIFGHLEILNLNRMNKTIQDSKRNFRQAPSDLL